MCRSAHRRALVDSAPRPQNSIEGPDPTGYGGRFIKDAFDHGVLAAQPAWRDSPVVPGAALLARQLSEQQLAFATWSASVSAPGAASPPVSGGHVVCTVADMQPWAADRLPSRGHRGDGSSGAALAGITTTACTTPRRDHGPPTRGREVPIERRAPRRVISPEAGSCPAFWCCLDSETAAHLKLADTPRAQDRTLSGRHQGRCYRATSILSDSAPAGRPPRFDLRVYHNPNALHRYCHAGPSTGPDYVACPDTPFHPRPGPHNPSPRNVSMINAARFFPYTR